MFGCSLSASGNLMTWSDRVKEYFDSNNKKIELLNLAVPASSNGLQIKRFQEYVVNHSLSSNDIIMWQVTGAERGYRRISNRIEKQNPSEITKLTRHNTAVFDKSVNYIDEKRRIDLLCHHPQCVGIDIDEEEVLQELLFCFKILKQFTDNVLVFTGWDKALPAEHLTKFTNYLKDNNIYFIDEAIITHCKRNNLPMLPDGEHPSEAGYISYADKQIVPLIKQLGWL